MTFEHLIQLIRKHYFPKKMNKYLSSKLKIISFISMILVVFLHSYNITVSFNSGNLLFNKGYNFIIQNFFYQGITRVAVPMFFIISGYLFFIKLKGNTSEFVLKYKKRTKSLLIPYLFWSVWSLLFLLILQIFPISKNFFTNELIVNYSSTKLLNTIFLNPIAYQLWFIRDLIVIVLFSPIIYWFIVHLRFIPLLLLFIIWVGFFNFNFYIFSNESIFFFCLGAYLAIAKSNLLLQTRFRKHYWIYALLWIIFVSSEVILIYFHPECSKTTTILHKIGILTGITTIWSSYDFFKINKNYHCKILFNLASFSFFLYAFHEPLLTIIKKGLFFITGKNEPMALAIYFLAPTLTIFISILVGYYIKRITPKFYKLISGGR